MGAWRTGYFDNDDAGELLDRVKHHGWRAAEDALRLIFNPPEEYLEAPRHGEAIAAAAIIATKAKGLTVSDFPDDLEFFAELSPPPAQLIPLAADALALVRTRSELGDLWRESRDWPDWLASIEALEKALRS